MICSKFSEELNFTSNKDYGIHYFVVILDKTWTLACSQDLLKGGHCVKVRVPWQKGLERLSTYKGGGDCNEHTRTPLGTLFIGLSLEWILQISKTTIILLNDESPDQLKFFNLLTPITFWQQRISGHFGDFQAGYGLTYKLQSTQKGIWQRHSMPFFPLVLCFATLSL